MTEGVKTWIARQVRSLREQRDWSQGDLARESGKKQSAISRIEDPDYGQLTLQTLFDLAKAYDLPLLVQFVEWQDWLYRMEDVSTEALRKESFDGEQLAALSGLQYQTANESLLTTYASYLSGSMTFAVNALAIKGCDNLVALDYDWSTDDEMYLDGFPLALEKLDNTTDQSFEDRDSQIDEFGWKPSLSNTCIAGLITHGH
jgi:transcriptional regulator with XRE-family HTH domain